MSIVLKSGVTSDVMTVDPVSKAARVSLYDASGNLLNPLDRAAIVPGAQGGALLLGADYRRARLLRASSTGTLRTSDDSIYLYDSVEGAAVDTNKWIQTTTTMTIAQAAGAITLNSGAITTVTTGAMHTSHRHFPFIVRTGLLVRARARAGAHFNGNLHEIGFGAPSTATATAVPNGAFWRKDSTGQWVPVLTFNSAETLGTPISNATFTASVATTDYATFEVFLEDSRAKFVISTATGAVVNEQSIEFSATTANFSATHIQAFYRTFNNTAPATAVQLFVSTSVVMATDSLSQRSWDASLSGMSYGPITSPTAYTQLANYTNSAAPTTRTLSNTAAAETTLGGLLVANSIAGAQTDLILFGFQVPSPYTFYFRGIKIPVPLNQVVAVATTEFLISYALAFNSSAVSLATAAPYAPMRVALPGFHRAAIALGANQVFTTGTEIAWQPSTPIAVFPGRFFHVLCRVEVGTATATETIKWNIPIDGYFE
jgi:hypothetical protein